MHQAFSKSHVDYMGPEFLNIAREKDWFSWKPNTLLFISLIKYSPYQTSFMSVKFTKELKKFENHENKREKKMYDFILKPTWACIWRGNKEAKTRGMRSYLLQISLFLDSFRDLSEISRGEGGGVGILNLGSEIRWPIPAMGVKFANPPLELGLRYHDPPPLV